MASGQGFQIVELFSQLFSIAEECVIRLSKQRTLNLLGNELNFQFPCRHGLHKWQRDILSLRPFKLCPQNTEQLTPDYDFEPKACWEGSFSPNISSVIRQ